MSALRKLLAVILDWPKTTVLLALALVAGGVYVSPARVIPSPSALSAL